MAMQPVSLDYTDPGREDTRLGYLASEAKKNSTALLPTACRQVELSSLCTLGLRMLLTFSMLPRKRRGSHVPLNLLV